MPLLIVLVIIIIFSFPWCWFLDLCYYSTWTYAISTIFQCFNMVSWFTFIIPCCLACWWGMLLVWPGYSSTCFHSFSSVTFETIASLNMSDEHAITVAIKYGDSLCYMENIFGKTVSGWKWSLSMKTSLFGCFWIRSLRIFVSVRSWKIF